MTDGTGMLQHASFAVPRREDGYCLDDNARALLVAVLVAEADGGGHDSDGALAHSYLAFVRHAWNGDAARFRNFMSYDRSWVEDVGSEDSHGRALWALGTVVGRSRDPSLRGTSAPLFHEALVGVPAMTSPRAWAFALLGIEEYLRASSHDAGLEALAELLSERLLELFRAESDGDWQWFEDRVTYCGARLSQALLLTGSRLGRADLRDVGLRSLEWLDQVQRSTGGCFAPVGSNGFYVRGRTKARFDQQPVEAGAMVSACLTAERVSGLDRWGGRAREALDWFLGRNELGRAVYDARTGGCRDGLHEDRVNENQGAESTLAFQLALLELGARDSRAGLVEHPDRAPRAASVAHTQREARPGRGVRLVEGEAQA
jgi:hypothetical protein